MRAAGNAVRDGLNVEGNRSGARAAGSCGLGGSENVGQDRLGRPWLDAGRLGCCGVSCTGGSGGPVVGSPITTAWVGAVNVGAGLREQGELSGTGSPRGVGASGGPHPGLLGKPPRPHIALERIAGLSLEQAPVDV